MTLSRFRLINPRAKNVILTSSIQFLYFSVIGNCSNIADPWLVFQLPVIDLRLQQKTIHYEDSSKSTWA